MPADFTLPLLCLAALAAGLVDSMVGGGSLIQLPALLLLLPCLMIVDLLEVSTTMANCGAMLSNKVSIGHS